MHPQLSGLGGLNGYACGAETVMDTWLALPAVQVRHSTVGRHFVTGAAGGAARQAQHARPVVPQDGHRPCAAVRADHWSASGMRAHASPAAAKYRVLIYSGDTDGCVPYVGSEGWTSGLGLTVTNDWSVHWTQRSA